MALLSSPLLLRLHALTLLALSYLLLLSPLQLLTSPALTLLGESMRLPPALFQPAFNPLTESYIALAPPTTELLAAIALLLSTLALMQLLLAGGLGLPQTLQFKKYATAAAANKEWRGQFPNLAGPQVSRARRGEDLAVLSASQNAWMALAVVRVAVEGVLVAWVYVTQGRREVLGRVRGVGGTMGLGGLGAESSVGANLGNQVVFSVALADMLFWGYLWTVVREERRSVFREAQEWQAAEEAKDE
ncbi:uncharacterized protein HMPREF1541_06728 [Cyphellophora europaea CBS 101466]|uniref:Uncharacterized protein n=1 Tax=Cyphellophora europaea (strain CBS 101466) TaxID=1220924 RepID=W2RQ81_CYPE1|nr:uncharacterized protein HMPREF1541_06728 [Cyphellophora europaea CBS 101466]ETN38691.1 hypothetical protein HMPREF1541_06728 [Cyphellophora europaea CBS 101466]